MTSRRDLALARFTSKPAGEPGLPRALGRSIGQLKVDLGRAGHEPAPGSASKVAALRRFEKRS
jgi:hypothetical protein